MSLIIKKFNVKSKTQIEFTLKFNNNIENIKKLNESLNIYYKDPSCKVTNLNINNIINDNITLCYDIFEGSLNEDNKINIPWHVKYLEYSLDSKPMMYYLTPFINHISEYHKIVGFNYVGELEIDLT
jgi:hypothetical protein